MATVDTKHLGEFLPALRDKTLTVNSRTVAEVERVAPLFPDYSCDERGCLRKHVNVFVGQDTWTTVSNNLPPVYSVRFG